MRDFDNVDNLKALKINLENYMEKNKECVLKTEVKQDPN